MNTIKVLGIIGLIAFVASSVGCVLDLSESSAGSIVLLMLNCIGIGMIVVLGWIA